MPACSTRSRALFGDVTIEQGYGMTEIWPVGGTVCEQGHLHFEPTHGLVETVDPETGRAAAPDAVASLVVTPFAPFRDTTLVIRYDTEDLVAPLGTARATCSLKALPATGSLLGKQRLSVRHADGWTCPRHVFDALEALDEVPLPARCGFWVPATASLSRSSRAATPPRSAAGIADALEAQGVPLRALPITHRSRGAAPTVPSARRPARGDLSDPLRAPTCGHRSTNPCALLVDAMEV